LDQESSRTGDQRGRNKPLPRVSGNGGTRGQGDLDPSTLVADASTEGRG
jgi:hypothetical protein